MSNETKTANDQASASSAETATQTLREKAREAVIAAVPEAAANGHRKNFHKLHVWRDGDVVWAEFVDRNSDAIDRKANSFRAVRNVITTGTNGYDCNCDHCENRGYPSKDAAIAASVADSDLSDLERSMLEAFDSIEVGYFDDEEEAEEGRG